MATAGKSGEISLNARALTREDASAKLKSRTSNWTSSLRLPRSPQPAAALPAAARAPRAVLQALAVAAAVVLAVVLSRPADQGASPLADGGGASQDLALGPVPGEAAAPEQLGSPGPPVQAPTSPAQPQPVQPAALLAEAEAPSAGRLRARATPPPPRVAVVAVVVAVVAVVVAVVAGAASFARGRARPLAIPPSSFLLLARAALVAVLAPVAMPPVLLLVAAVAVAPAVAIEPREVLPARCPPPASLVPLHDERGDDDEWARGCWIRDVAPTEDEARRRRRRSSSRAQTRRR